ncbi:uncharacterized protein MYCFIDRAFT_179703 [Pseudocercospora fijiensis CIRAD86]|uniref:Uncharacterized protein n=1 Tax=Pseudocercospora fijiensis (strain CIRAD86) TaxID=383855 RepID=M2ZED0_PSEFD|nr:uncharacterized protein MYCFIDRAFT_179703 [Pseudocercospora fijiensis CIRAD86]EME77489.1 hypothetical protein MYCFIDRAFT_179703 [Pseudocercospora fijiensis CIRAD86]
MRFGQKEGDRRDWFDHELRRTQNTLPVLGSYHVRQFSQSGTLTSSTPRIASSTANLAERRANPLHLPGGTLTSSTAGRACRLGYRAEQDNPRQNPRFSSA